MTEVLTASRIDIFILRREEATFLLLLLLLLLLLGLFLLFEKLDFWVDSFLFDKEKAAFLGDMKLLVVAGWRKAFIER